MTSCTLKQIPLADGEGLQVGELVRKVARRANGA